MTHRDPSEATIPVAVALATAVADYDADAVSNILTILDRQQLYTLAVLLAAHVDLDRPITLDLPDAVTPGRLVTRAVAVAAEMFRVTPDDVLSESRHRPSLDARAVAMAALRLCGMSSPQVGAAFHRDHSTVLHAAGRVGADRRLHALAKRVALQCGWKRDDNSAGAA